MTEKEKAHIKFEKLLLKTINSAKPVLNRKIVKAMNAVDKNGIQYESEYAIMEAYSYEMISPAERDSLLKAIEYMQDRPLLMEDYLISLCKRALHLIDSDKYADAPEKKQREFKNKVAKIKHDGGTALQCYCCNNVIGDIDYKGKRTEYYNYTECSKGRVCTDCLAKCRSQCKQGEKTNEDSFNQSKGI